MPSALDVMKSSKKRKRESSQDDTGGYSSILEIERQILESRRNYNKIVTLLSHCWNQDPQKEDEENTLAVVALCRIFCRLMALGSLSKDQDTSGNEATVVQWLNDRFNDYKDILLETLSQGDVTKQSTALTLLMRLFKEEATRLKKSDEAVWQTGTFAKALKFVMDGESSADVRNEFVQQYVEEYDDVRFYTFSRLT